MLQSQPNPKRYLELVLPPQFIPNGSRQCNSEENALRKILKRYLLDLSAKSNGLILLSFNYSVRYCSRDPVLYLLCMTLSKLLPSLLRLFCDINFSSRHPFECRPRLSSRNHCASKLPFSRGFLLRRKVC